MIKKKVLLVAVMLSVALASNISFAEPIVELAAPRMAAPKILPDDGSTVTKPQTTNDKTKTSQKQQKKQSIKKGKRYIHKKPPVFRINYDKISKLIEYGYYDYADKILEGAICRNPKDIKAQALWVVSLSKQCKLAPAQSELNNLLKKYPDNSNLHYAQGVVYYQRTTSSNMAYRTNSKQLLNSAMKEFKTAINLDKNNARAYNAAGVISIKLGNNKDAVDYFKKALVADKTYSLAIDNLGTIDLSAGKLKEAEKKFKESLTYNTQNTTAMYHLAQIYMQKQDYSTALDYLNNSLYINENSPAIYNLMGKAYASQGNEAAAINAFKKSVMVKPEFTLSYLDLADVYDKRGDSEFAIEQLKTALSIDPNYCDARLKLADISLTSGKYKQAIDTYAQLIGVDGYNTQALKGLASAYYGQAQTLANKSLSSTKEVYNALDCINRAIDANPKDLELHLAKLKLNQYLNQPEQSKEELNKIIASSDNDISSLVIKGEAYSALNDYQNAKKQFDEAIKLSNTPDDDTYLSEILLFNKQLDSAQAVFNKILKYDAKNQEALNGIEYIKKSKQNSDNFYKSALYFEKHNNLSSALEYYSKAVSSNPANSMAYLHLAQIYERAKDYKNAVKNYKGYLSLTTDKTNTKLVQRKIQKLENEL